MSKKQSFLNSFGFHTLPFTREIQVKDRFLTESHEQAVEHLYRSVHNRFSAVLVAPAGTGKTLVLRCLADRLPETRYRVRYLKVTGLSKRDFCREIATAIGTESAGTYPVLVRRLQEHFLQDTNIDSVRPVLLVDEAQDLKPDVLNILNILTNFEMDSRLVVSIVLAGQPGLQQLLQHKNHQDTAQRMAHKASLQLLSQKQIQEYIQHRCRIAGTTNSLFDNDSVMAVYEIGKGNLRATDHLALKSLEVAHDADSQSVNSNHVIQARAMLWN